MNGVGRSFNPHLLIRDTRSPFLLHLHGSVRYYFVGGNGLDRTEIRRAPDWTFAGIPNASRHLFNADLAQSGEALTVGTMITGLRKTDKVTRSPYGHFQYKLQDALLKSPRLLVIGYGAGDIYLNAVIVQMRKIHGNRLRSAVIVMRELDAPATDAERLAGVLAGFDEQPAGFPGFIRAADLASAADSIYVEPVSNCALFCGGVPLSGNAFNEILDHLAGP
jgi:hypothetical protein